MSKNTANPTLPKAADQSAAPSGYQRTEVGLIPVDWDVKTLNDLGSFMKGKGIKRDDVTDDGLACIRYGELYTRYNNYVYSPASRIPESVAQTAQPLKTGDLLFAGSGETAEEIGKCVAYLGEEEAYAGGDIVILRPVEQNSLYLGHLLNHAVVAEQKARYGQGDAVVHISARNLAMVKLPLPPTTHEQDAIAEALSDVDGLIGALEKLIAKKRAIKQAAMQQLLTGKTRLPGFSGKWNTKRIADIASPCSERNSLGEDLPVLTCSKHLGFVDSLAYFKNQVFSKDLSSYKIIRRGQLGYPANHIEEGSIGFQDMYDVALVSPIYVVCAPSDDVSGYFLHRLLKLDSYRQAFATATTSSVDRRGSLRWPAFSEIRVAIPPLDEQLAIAEVLSDVENEISATERRLWKTKQIKQCMMQQLLTGRVRLVNGEATA